MAVVNFKVTEVNDLSADGPAHKRVVMESSHDRYDTGPVKGDTHAFRDNATVEGTITLVVKNETQEEYFKLDSIQAVSFLGMPTDEAIAARDKAARDAAVEPKKK